MPIDSPHESGAASVAESPPRGDAARTSTLSFLFTDIEGSTRRWEEAPDAMRAALRRHDTILEEAISGSNGRIVKKAGDGVMAVFSSIGDAIAACLAAQSAIGRAAWQDVEPLRVRMALHCGEVEERASDYFGPAVNRTARILAAGHGGQILLSSVAAGLARDQLAPDVGLEDLGEHRLKDLERPERIFQIVAPGLDTEFPPLVTLGARPNNLPMHGSAFIGREAQLQEIRRLLDEDGARLVTLTGPGGTGKTRLALRAAADQIERYDDGVFFVDLASATDEPTVVALIAREIGLTETRDVKLAEEVKRHLARRRVLLILDNFEQVTVAAPTVAELLSASPGLCVLVTSRQPLRIRGEQQFPVPPLSVPKPEGPQPTAAQLGQFEALQLFVDRARAVRPDFRLTDDNAAAVAEICRRLDGLPLAIELATARLKIFSPDALRDRLGSRLKLLRSGGPDLPERQQTLNATIDWSYRLLEADEQRLFQVLSVFSGVTLEALEAVAGALDALAEHDVVEGLGSLVDNSLVREEQTAIGHAAPRFEMLETIREYGLARLDDDPAFASTVRAAHATRFAAYARRQWEVPSGERRDAALARLEVDLDNLRAAWRHLVGQNDLAGMNQLLDGLWLLYDSRGWFHASMELLTDALRLLEAAPASREVRQQEVTLRMGLARTLLSLKGYSADVETAYQEALGLFEADPELSGLFPVLRSLASYYLYRSELHKSAEIGRKILQLAEDEGDPSMRVDGHLMLGMSMAFGPGPLRQGLEHLETAIAGFDALTARPPRLRLGNDPRVACLTGSALILWFMGRLDQARDRADRAVDLAAVLEHPWSQAYALYHSGFLHLWRREPHVAKARAQALLLLLDQHEVSIWRALANVLLGAANSGLGHAAEGLGQFDEGLQRYEGLATPPMFWPMIKFLRAGALLAAGRPELGLNDIDEALHLVGPEDTISGDFLALKGDLLRAIDPDKVPEARRLYEQAFAASVLRDVLISQLRAATRLAAIGGQGEDLERLRSVYARFQEGFETADLLDAAALLAKEA